MDNWDRYEAQFYRKCLACGKRLMSWEADYCSFGKCANERQHSKEEPSDGRHDERSV
jgi:hypothetical protein